MKVVGFLLTLILILSFTIKGQEIKIGTQTWTSKNLDVSTYRNGDIIPEVQDSIAWCDLTIGAWCYNENKAENGTTYGKLYNWYAVNDPRGLAPTGYHIPTDAEWTILINYLGGESVAATKMTSEWKGNGWKNSGSFFPGGCRIYMFKEVILSADLKHIEYIYTNELCGAFIEVDGMHGSWWSSTQLNPNFSWDRELDFYEEHVSRDSANNRAGFSVRCLRDIPLLSIKAQDVTIGTQTWTSKNLNVCTYRNGDTIPQAQNKNDWNYLTTGAWCYYENKTANGTTYGKLYNWYAVNDPRGIAPKGYHIPTDEEWTILTDYLGGEELAGAKMTSRSGWLNNRNGTNTSGFAALPGGSRDGDGTFYFIGNEGYWWSSGDENDDAWVRGLTGSLYKGSFNRSSGFSVRCLRD